MNRQPYHTPPRWWPPALRPWWVRLLRPLRHRLLRRQLQIERIDVAGVEHLRAAVASGGVLITPNHSAHYDTYALYNTADQLGRPFYVLTAWQVFAMSGWFERWNLRNHGCFSIDREGADLKAFRRCVEILVAGRNPLVIYPEGDIYHLNDRVTPFRDGAAVVALAAARRRGQPIACVPCAVKFQYLEDPTPKLVQFMDRLERHAGIEPRPTIPLAARVCRFTETLLARKEIEYLGRSGSGSLTERTQTLSETILQRIEQRTQVVTRGPSPERIKDLRRAIIEAMEADGCDTIRREQLVRDLDDLFFVLQLYSYPPDYLAESPTVERLAETLDKLEEDVLGAALPSVRGRRRVQIRFGEAILARADAGRRTEAARLTGLLQSAVQQLLDAINQGEMMLELLDVSKSFGDAEVLRPTTLAVPHGRTMALIGPSGCGKSTLLRLILGLVRPDTGTVRLDGEELTSSNVLAWRQRVGYVLQDGGLFPHLTARDNVTLLARHLRWPRKRIDGRVTELAELTRFPTDGLDRYPVQLSGGQRQRVGLMRALMLDPPVVLLDEPMAALDPIVRFDLQEDLHAAFRSLRKTVVLVTHDMAEAEFFGDTVVLMGEGRIVQQGRIEDMVAAPADPFVRRFIRAQRVPQSFIRGGRP